MNTENLRLNNCLIIFLQNSISDHDPKYLLTPDDDPPVSHNGIRQLNALEWLLNK